MPTKRNRGSSWEFVVRRRGLLPKPLYLTFADEAEGDAYCAKLEALLDRGIVPDEILREGGGMATVADAIDAYVKAVAVKPSDVAYLGVVRERIGADRLMEIHYAWGESWVRSMKQTQNLSPSTIRHYVGALARCFDWVSKRQQGTMPSNPLRMLARGYATYNEHDALAVQSAGGDVPADDFIDRRLHPDEEKRIRAILAGEKPEGRQRAFALPHREALAALFDLALESGMRLSECYTLGWDQVDIAGRTIQLSKTKNGSRRQVPMTTVAVRVMSDYRNCGDNSRSCGNDLPGLVFPWWDGQQTQLSRQRTTSRLSRQFGRIFDAAGCPDFTFHILRHECISRLYERTSLDSAVIQKIVGHFSATAHNRYISLRASTIASQLW